MTTAIEQQLADLTAVLGVEGKLQELDDKRHQERVEALRADLASERAELVTEQSDVQNAQAKLDKTRASKELAARKADELESQVTHAISGKHRAGRALDKRKARIAELVSALQALGVTDA